MRGMSDAILTELSSLSRGDLLVKLEETDVRRRIIMALIRATTKVKPTRKAAARGSKPRA